MRAIWLEEPGAPDALEMRELADPPVIDGCVRVAVHASGINRADLLQRRGLYPPPEGTSKNILGLEIAGVVESVGYGVSQWKEGDRVMAIVSGAGYADRAVVPARELLPIPDGVSFAEAACFPEAFSTAYDAIVLQGALAAGQTLIVHAAASGVGLAAGQVARAIGARAIGTSRTPAKLEKLAEKKWTELIHAGPDGWWDALRDKVGYPAQGGGAHVVLDFVGGAYLGGNIRCLRPRGTLMVVGLLGGVEATLPLGILLRRRLAIRGTVLRARPAEERAVLAQIVADRLVPLFGSGTLEANLGATWPADEVVAAHRAMERNDTFGCSVLVWSDGTET